MKKHILLFLIFLPVMSFAQITYIVKGELSHINSPAKIFLLFGNGGRSVIDSALIKDHKFEFTGTAIDTTEASVIVDYPGKGLDDIWGKRLLDAKRFYLINGITTVNGSDSLYNANISGNKLNDEFERYSTLLWPVTNKLSIATTGSQYNEAEAQRKLLSEKFLENNRDSYVSLDKALKNIVQGYVDPDSAESVFLLLSKNLRSTKQGIAYQLYLNNTRKTSVGLKAPEIIQADTSGKLITLSSFKGRYVLIDFWASWCPPCRAENPNLVKVFNKYRSKNFTILGVSLDKPGKKDNWLDAIHKDCLTWYQVADLQGFNNTVALNYGIQVVPQNFLIDPSGEIIAKNLFGDDLSEKLKSIFDK